jgi:ankyrin repeat protein
LLLDAGADIHSRCRWNETALFSLEDDVIEELIRRGINIEARNEFGQTALINTVSESVASRLIQAGADVNAKDKEGRTALILAAEHNYLGMIRVLVKAPGIRLDIRDRQGMTALRIARIAGRDECARILSEAGAR